MTVGQRIRRRRLARLGFAGRRGPLYTVLLVAVAIFAVGMGLTGAGAMYGLKKYDEVARGVLPPEQLLAQLPHGGARIYDRNGVLLYQFIDAFGGLRQPVPLGDISPWMQKATVSTEDSSFYDNSGINLTGLIRAGLENFSPFGGGLLEGSGGSSITQQVAKTVYIPQQQRYERSVTRKLRETVIALELTKRYSKDQILGWYLNSISYGSVYVGIQAASQGYFGKDAKDLTLAQAALLAGIPQSPAAYEPVNNPEAAKTRQGEVLELMVKHGAITQQQADDARKEPINLQPTRFDITAPHFVLGPVMKEVTQRFGDRALYDDGLNVTTTLDVNLQKIGENVVEKNVAAHEADVRGHNGAMIAMDPHNGQVLAYVGSRDYFREDILGQNDNITSLRSPGSTLKPFTYITAFQQGWSTGTGIVDSPASVFDPSTGKSFTPTNPGGGTLHGLLTVAQALGNSLNIPAFKTIVAVGVDKTLTNYKAFGLTHLGDISQYGPSLTLGGVDVRLDDITYAYSSLAGEGMLRGQQPLTPHATGERSVDPVVLLKITDSANKTLYEFEQPVQRQVMGAQYAYLATSILSDGQNTCITFGCNYLDLSDHRPAAHKTGTSEPYENAPANSADTWAFGYTPDLVAGVWAGNSDSSPMVNIFSTTIAWPIWRDFMDGALKQMEIPSKPFNRPPGVQSVQLCWPSGRLMTDLCPAAHSYQGLMASEAIPTDKDRLAKLQDSWWQRIAIDTRTGLLAAPGTPALFVDNQVRLVLPQAELDAWPGFAQWVQDSGIGALLAPSATVSSSAQNAVNVISPTNGQRVSGTVTVTGHAASPDFQRYVVEWGRGANPTDWTPLSTSTTQVQLGTLGTWNVGALPDGDYAVRVRLTDAKLGELRYAVQVVIGKATTTAGQPVAAITSPQSGALVTGSTPIVGTAAVTSGSFADYVLELGEGASPSRWTQLRRGTTQVVNGSLGTLEPAGLGLRNGFFTLRLTVHDSAGNATVATVILDVELKGR